MSIGVAFQKKNILVLRFVERKTLDRCRFQVLVH
jgi:hypothetical protein